MVPRCKTQLQLDLPRNRPEYFITLFEHYGKYCSNFACPAFTINISLEAITSPSVRAIARAMAIWLCSFSEPRPIFLDMFFGPENGRRLIPVPCSKHVRLHWGLTMASVRFKPFTLKAGPSKLQSTSLVSSPIRSECPERCKA